MGTAMRTHPIPDTSTLTIIRQLWITAPGVYDGLDISGYMSSSKRRTSRYAALCAVANRHPGRQRCHLHRPRHLVEDVAIMSPMTGSTASTSISRERSDGKHLRHRGRRDDLRQRRHHRDSYLHDFATLPTTTQADGKTHNDGVQIRRIGHRHSPQQHSRRVE